MKWCAAIVLLSLASGCSSETTEPDGVRAFELGTGSWRFEPIEDGAQLDMVHGAQGGWHVWLAFRVDGIDDEDLLFVTTETQLGDESRAPHVTRTRVPFEAPDIEGHRVFVGWTEILDDPSCMLGAPLRVKATLELPDGSTLTDERYITPMGGAYPPPACEP